MKKKKKMVFLLTLYVGGVPTNIQEEIEVVFPEGISTVQRANFFLHIEREFVDRVVSVRTREV